MGRHETPCQVKWHRCPRQNRALLMTFYIALKHISMTLKYRKVKINNCMKAENLNIYQSWEWSQHGFTYRSQEVLLKNPLDGYDMYVLCSITCFCLLSTLYHDFAWCFLDYTSAVPLYYVFTGQWTTFEFPMYSHVVVFFVPDAAHHAIKVAFHRHGGWMKSAKSFAAWVSVVLSSFALAVVSQSSRRPWPWSGYVKLRTLKVTDWRQFNLLKVSCSKRKIFWLVCISTK